MARDQQVNDLQTGTDGTLRCPWCAGDSLYEAYHDQEWGVPCHDEHALFEKLCLETFQAGLSWIVVLRRRAGLREALGGFDPKHLAQLQSSAVEELMHDQRLIRNRAKIEAIIHNARILIEKFPTEGSFATFLWSFAPSIHTAPTSIAQIPARTEKSAIMARELKRIGWKFIGPVSAYAFMQSIGMINDHLLGCSFRENS